MLSATLRPMAKPKAEFPPADAIHALVDEERRLAVRVTPGARVEALEIADGRLLAKVCARPEDGKANAAVREMLAKALGVAAMRVKMLRGATSREKLFQITD